MGDNHEPDALPPPNDMMYAGGHVDIEASKVDKLIVRRPRWTESVSVALLVPGSLHVGVIFAYIQSRRGHQLCHFEGRHDRRPLAR